MHYTVDGPTGLPLGQAQLHARQTAGGWEFDLTLDAGVPGYAVSDRYHAAASAKFCSLQFKKVITHGRRQREETTTFDYKDSVARRANSTGGAKSEMPISACARDALTFLFLTRSELEQGRVPSAQVVFAGASYQVQMESGGVQPVKVGAKTEDADHVLISVKGPASDFSFEAFFARDKGRTPLVVRCPFVIGTISLELVR